jgi:hypothetical protein
VTRSARFLAAVAALSLASAPAQGALLSLTIVSGLQALSGDGVIPEPLGQESLSGSTLTQLGNPLLFDPTGSGTAGITVRITNTSANEVLFPDLLPGISVLTGVTALPGYSTRTNVATGGAAGKPGSPGTEGAVSRTALDLTLPLDVAASPVVGSYGGGGGAGTGVADNLIAVTGASGAELAAFLAGRRLLPGEWIDVPDFLRVVAFHRSSADARIALGFDLPTFSSGGISVTTGAWTGSFAQAAPQPPEPPPATAAEPGSLWLLVGGLGAAGSACRRPSRQRGQQRARE